MTSDSIREQARELPRRPGVYLFRDAEGSIIYVGKARSLRDRVRSYFGAAGNRSYKERELSRRVAGIETFVVESDAEALLLESNLIKEHAPRFNIRLRDDKTFPYVKVTLNEPFPRILVTRRLERDGARYFGPFTDVAAMRRALRLVRRLFTVRSCHYDLPGDAPHRPCLDYHIHRCKAPCVGYQDQADYREMIDRILAILSGDIGGLKRDVRQEMEHAAQRLDFERAAELRDVLRGLGTLERRQTSIDFRGGDRDVFGVAIREDEACCLFLRVRDGKLLGRDVHFMTIGDGEGSLEEVTAAALKGIYPRRDDLPPELLVPCEFEDLDLLESVLSERRGAAVLLRVPQRGRKKRLLDLAVRNAEHLLADRRAGSPAVSNLGDTPAASAELAACLGLESPPRSLVCFDISTLSGTSSVGSAIWLADGSPRKSEYRRFQIRDTPEGHTDDYSMMQEVVGRYFQRRVGENLELPDLVVVDGGKGQLHAALHAMESAGVSDLPALSLAKRAEEVFVPGSPAPIRLERRNPGLQWLQRARDEAHRFAVGYNRDMRRRRTLTSRLSGVPGVGPRREVALLKRFGSVKRILDATPEEIATVPGIGLATAVRILEELKREGRT